MMDEATESKLTRESILNLRFPYKLWILINLPNSVLSWGPEADSILLDFAALNTYLLSSASIFKLKTGHKFLRQLTLHGFDRVADREDSKPSVILEFKHANFKHDREDLVGKIQRENNLLKQMSKYPCQESFTQSHVTRPADPCFSKVRPLTFIERARLHLSIFLQVQSENFALNKKLTECERKSPTSAVSVIELPADSFENPFDSISQFEENSEYAGYYGSASTEQIKQFFDEYLPIYAQADGEQIADRSKPLTSQKESQSKQHTPIASFSYVVPNQNEEMCVDDPSAPPNFQIKYSVDLDATADNKEYTLNILEEKFSQIASSDAGTDATMPCYAESGEVNNVSGRDEDISMDEYLKFKDNPDKSLTKCEPIAECDIDVKPEILENNDGSSDGVLKNSGQSNVNGEANDEGESNFKNFFNQYRESINLLYE